MSVITPDIYDRSPEPEREREEWEHLMDFGQWAVEKYGCVIEPIPDEGSFSHIKVTHDNIQEMHTGKPHYEAAKTRIDKV